MKDQNVSADILSDRNNTTTRIFDLILGRVLKRVYLGLDKVDKKEMEKVFLSKNNEKKEEFIKKYIPNFKEIFKEEAKKIEKEIEEEIEEEIKK